jgi:Na+-translocating ferredoxin:NAD+ oxidoreductase RNF subunit RnfB
VLSIWYPAGQVLLAQTQLQMLVSLTLTFGGVCAEQLRLQAHPQVGEISKFGPQTVCGQEHAQLD